MQQRVRNASGAAHRTRAPTALVTAAALALALSGCGGGSLAPRAKAMTRVSSASGAAAGAGTGPARSPGGSVDCRRTRCVALTFDDSPSVRTPRILDILRRYRVRATFFTLGRDHVVAYPGTVRRMAAEGHEVETLTWSHRILTGIGPAEARKEITRGRDAVAKVIGRRPVLLRPPQGRTSPAVAAICRRLGMAQVLWSATASDYETTDSALITRRILARTGPGGIILLHDRVDPSNRGYNGTVAAIPGIISGLRAGGYTFVTVTRLLSPAGPRPGEVYRDGPLDR
ncbi:polysaccharide deacetylase family protein [Streptomyces sp. 6-11-2]|uniref:polysaccharide deacetylase family protein n=1 Tax=Streptomyces sp. 6-11-2 TaxID=2585753 RepID=UPI0011687CC9|nr:polysaccharide deacetylase family protein [Streptomyces sp. 6-11-2]GED90300.1 deacetylase [Streptomyces sp. 6-11-2]